MDFTQLESGNGFFLPMDFIQRMSKLKPPRGDYYQFEQSGGSFSQVAVIAYGTATMRLFRIYTGNKDLYDYIKGVFHESARLLGLQAKSKEWNANS